MAQVFSDIFGRRPLDFGGAFAADSAHIELSLGCQLEIDPLFLPDLVPLPGSGVFEPVASGGLLTQQLNIQYQQPITRLYEVGTQKTYYVAGRPQGSANVARVLGPGTIMAALYECLGDVCMADQNDLCFCIQANCLSLEEAELDENFHAMQIALKNVVLQSLGFSIQAQDMVINEQMSLFFTAMLAVDSQDGCQGAQNIGVQADCIHG